MSREATVAETALGTDDAGTEVAVVVLAVGESYVPVTTTRAQALAIDAGHGNREREQSDEHDLVSAVVGALDGEVDAVSIDALRDDTFHATIRVVQSLGGREREHEIDARATDAIALAGRVDCPIRVADAVVEAAGITHEEAIDRGLPVEGEPISR